MPIGTALHERTRALCETLSYRDWSGYYAASAYEVRHAHEYTAIRTAAGLIDVSPLYKYLVTGRDAARLVDRIITRDVGAMAVGQVVYTPWCDERGKVIDDGTVTRLGDQTFRWTAADPNLRWLCQNADGLEVEVRDLSTDVAALAIQGPTSAAILRGVSDIDVDALRYFRATRGRIDGVAVDVSRTGYTGDLGYEIWIPSDGATRVWDALMEAGTPLGLRAAGMLAVDMARIEAGLLLIDVDFFSSKKALIQAQQYSPFEMGLGRRLVSVDKAPFVGQRRLNAERRAGSERRIVGLEIDWLEFEAVFDRIGMAPQVPAAASREAVPVYAGDHQQVGKATSTTWSPLLQKLICLATVSSEHARVGSRLRVEVTVDAVRHTAAAAVVPTPFFNPRRKTAIPPP